MTRGIPRPVMVTEGVHQVHTGRGRWSAPVAATRQGGPEVPEVVHRQLRTPRRDEARVRVEACSVSAVDMQARQGTPTYPPRFPSVPAYVVVGVVDAVGDGVTAVPSRPRGTG